MPMLTMLTTVSINMEIIQIDLFVFWRFIFIYIDYNAKLNLSIIYDIN